MSSEEHVVDTPWGKLVTAKGLEILMSSFSNDINRLYSAITKLDERLNKLEMSISSSQGESIDPLIGSSLSSLEQKIEELKEEQSRFALHMKQTLELFYSKLEE
ncbi:hypothetical protein CEE45_04275 [Candidatus Heimdallarchaeota archaeon B3_Heim]|nr:MAG: hypothetical protein CEE45_04275 [Candidatus Heimdallarchaeota archaeon B3_Heim]